MANIFVIEDEEDIVDYIKMCAEESGHKVFSADSPKAAAEKCRNQRFDLILVDLHLNGGLGADLIDKIRVTANGLNTETPIVIISGNIESQTITKIGKKINGALVKPFSPEQLQEIFTKHIAIKHALVRAAG